MPGMDPRANETEARRRPSPIIQPRHGEQEYPIGRVVLDRAKVLGLTRTELVRRLGYTSLSNGHRTLSGVLLTGAVPPFIAKTLAAALELDQDLIDTLLRATDQQRHDEARTRMLGMERAYHDAFRPHLQIQTERRIPSPIFVAALLTTERLRIIRLPAEAFAVSDEERDRFLRGVIVEHYRCQRAQVPAFGAITGYILVLIAGYGGFDFGLPFDMDGNRAGTMRSVSRLPEAGLDTKAGGSRLSGLLKDTPIRVIQVDG
jgi:hypothetical protein